MIAGIDLGTTNSLIGVMDAGFPLLLADGEGRRILPSVVHYPADGGAAVVGHEALRRRALAPERTVVSVKRFMGVRRGEEPEAEGRAPYRLAGDPGDAVGIDPGGGRMVSPEEVSAEILGVLKRRAEEAMGGEVAEAVVTVPAYFNDAQRAATRRAGELAGFTVRRILNEPTAAALAYGIDRRGMEQKVAVYDFGGGTFDISVIAMHGEVTEVLSTNGDTRLGGDDIDRAVLNWLTGELGIDETAVDPVLASRLAEAVVAAKHRLSSEDSVRLEIPFAGPGGNSYAAELTRGRFERLAAPVVDRTHAHCLRALSDAGLKPGDLDEVLLVGGSTRIPLVRERVAEWFGAEPDTSQHPDEAVALGATLQAGVLSGVVRDTVLLDVTPLSLGVETFGGLMNVIIPRNTTIPVKAGEMFTNAVANQKSMLVRVLQGERELAKDNWELGRLEIPFAPAHKGQARVGVQFEIDADGILHVLARDTHTGQEVHVTLTSTVDVEDEKVEAMIAESVEHAFEDMNERVLTEARMKGREMLQSVDKGLALAGDSLKAGERRLIAEKRGHLAEAIESAPAADLKSAIQELDEATRNMATLLIERATEMALRRRGGMDPD